MTSYRTSNGLHGLLLQSATPKRLRDQYGGARANGLLVRGVVIAVYTHDKRSAVLLPADSPEVTAKPSAAYCDVLVYSGRDYARFSILQRVLVTADQSGLHDGDIWMPRASTIDLSTADLDAQLRGVDVANLDGDHVLVGFIDDDLRMPVLLRCIPHPSASVGNDDARIGVRTWIDLSNAENPRLKKYRGTFYGVDGSGNFIIDSTHAHSGAYERGGTEPLPPETSSGGSYFVRLPKGARLSVETESGAVLNFHEGRLSVELPESASFGVQLGGSTLEVYGNEENAHLVLGPVDKDENLKHVAIVEHLQALYEELKARFDAHTHVYAFGPTLQPDVPAPDWNSAINSSKMALPDG